MKDLSQISTFFNLPSGALGNGCTPSVAIVGVTSSCASAFDGAQNAAYFIRNMSKAFSWQAEETAILDIGKPGITMQSMIDFGDVSGSNQVEIIDGVKAAVELLSPDTVPIFVGGDHSVSFGTVAALSDRSATPIVVVSFDHHFDVQFWETELDLLFNTNVMSHISTIVGPGRIVHLGVDPLQSVPKDRRSDFLSDLKKMGTQIALGSPDLACDDAILDAIDPAADVYISFDVDVLHRNEIASTGYPSDYGMSLERALAIIEVLFSRNKIVGCDLVEFVADRADRSERTLADAGRATRVLLSLLLAIEEQSSKRASSKKTA